MGEDPADHPGILNGRDQAHAAATARTSQYVELEGTSHKVRPRPRATRAGSLRLKLRDARRARGNSACLPQRRFGALVGDGAGAPASMGGEDSMVQHKIDARARSQGGELFEEFQGLEEQVAGAIVPGALELQQDAAVPGEPKAILSDRGPQQVAAELLEPRTVFCGNEQVGVEIEALKVGLAGPGAGDPQGIGLAPEAEDAGSGPPAERDTSLHGGAREAGQGERLLGEGGPTPRG